jgi:hypothetical protein
MIIQKYSVNQYPVQHILTWIQSGEIAIPEIQRPFVWSSTQVRDFFDSLYKGYPVGYLIAWKNPNIRLKDGSISQGKRILIDGQQRVTALMTSILGYKIIDKDYQTTKISIAFNPIERKFEVTNPAIKKDVKWIADISEIFNNNFKMHQFVKEYVEINGIIDFDQIFEAIESLRGIVNNPIGIIELSSELDIDTVNEIFIRINSAGLVLSQADFAMSKIAVNEKYGGNILRKAIDYFCHMAIVPEFYNQLQQLDKEFIQTEYFQKMSWLKDENDNLYDPLYTDMLRVAFTFKFKRGKLEDLVALLSGRNFETREYEEKIAEESFSRLSEGIMDYMNENNFKRFIMIIRSAGFIDNSMIRSQNALNFAYILYLLLRELKFNQALIETLVRKWFVLSVLTSRYSGSPESQFDFDIKQISQNPKQYIKKIIEAELSDAFWNLGLPQQMNTSVASSPSFNVFLAAQVKMNDKGFLSRDITVRELIELKGDVHHIFPREYLKKQGYNRGFYNQIANYVIAQSEINIKIGAKAPNVYFQEIIQQCKGGKLKYGGIISVEELQKNMRMHCIPDNIIDMDASNYEQFLEERRKLMAMKIKNYFLKL